jgi:hypothetical protein
VRVYFTRESFFTMHTGHLPVEHTSAPSATGESILYQAVPQVNGQGHLYKDVTCARSDLIGHGLKNIGSVYWTGDSRKCDRDMILKGHGANEVCKWLTKKEELLIAKHYCFWRSPVCWDSITGRNICMDDDNVTSIAGIGMGPSNKGSAVSKCEIERFNLQRYSLCVNYDMCNPLLTFRQFRKNVTAASNRLQSFSFELATPWVF